MVDKNIFAFTLHVICIAAVLGTLDCVLPSFITIYYRQIGSVLLFVHISCLTYDLARQMYFRKRIKSMNKAVLITGCDTGFGHELAKRLDSRGFTVYASCLFPSGNGATALKEKCSNNLHILELDVTKDDSVNSAVEFVKKNLGICDLWAIVNNAGIQKGFAFEFSSLPEYKDTMEVNAFGVVRVTKAFISLLRKSKGRVINVTSLAGRIPTPYIGPYCMSKHAAVAFNECLRQEMDTWNIRVISIEPECFKTQMLMNFKKRAEESLQNKEGDVQEVYDKKVMSKLKRYIESSYKVGSKHISIVIDDMESAVCLKNPTSVYRPSRNIVAQVLYYVTAHTPQTLIDITLRGFLYLSEFPILKKQSAKGSGSYMLFMRRVCYKLLLKFSYYCGLYEN